MPLVAVSPRKRYVLIAEQIVDSIRAGEYAPGSRLPSERDLAQVLGVSRPVLREALSALEMLGILEIRAGQGIYVTAAPDTVEFDAAGVTSDLSPEAPEAILAARLVLEPAIAAAAATAASVDAIRALQHCQDEMRLASGHIDAVFPAGVRFHQALAEATGNPLLMRVMDGLTGLMASPLSKALNKKALVQEGCDIRHHAEHQLILEALIAHDPIAAASAMQQHCRTVARDLLGDDADRE